jgi:hypothetical protein
MNSDELQAYTFPPLMTASQQVRQFATSPFAPGKSNILAALTISGELAHEVEPACTVEKIPGRQAGIFIWQ